MHRVVFRRSKKALRNALVADGVAVEVVEEVLDPDVMVEVVSHIPESWWAVDPMGFVVVSGPDGTGVLTDESRVDSPDEFVIRLAAEERERARREHEQAAAHAREVVAVWETHFAGARVRAVDPDAPRPTWWDTFLAWCRS